MPTAALTARFTAAAIDLALFVGAFLATGVVAVFVAAALGDNLLWVWPVQLAVLAVGGIANLAVLQGRRGASIGKSVAGVAVVDDAHGGPIGVPRALARLVVHVVIDPIMLIGPLLLVVDSAERRTVADRVCATVVVGTRPVTDRLR